MAGKMPVFLTQNASLPYESLQPEVKEQLIRELHTYPRKNNVIARIIWIILGIVGGHRFYLGKIGTGLVMLCTLGGGLIWWIIDGFKLHELVAAYNNEQAERERTGKPPIDMDFVPVMAAESLTSMPLWSAPYVAKRYFFWEVFADVLVLAFFSFALGAFSASTGYLTGALAVGAVVVMINFADLLLPLHTYPLVNTMIHWDFRLRLFYHFNPPGRRLALYFRPLTALFYAPFKKKARTEVLLYLQIGSVFFAFKVLGGLLGGEIWTQIWALDFDGFLGDWLSDVIIGFLAMYGFAAPVGAILMKHILLRRPNYIRWGFSFLVVFLIIKGFLSE